MVVEAAGLQGGLPAPTAALSRAESVVNRLFPAAFSLLSRPEKVAVYLTEFEGLTPAEAGVVLGTSDAAAATMASEALTKLRDSIALAATLDERDLLAISLPASWIRTSLRDTLGDHAGQPDEASTPDATSNARGLLDTPPPPRRRPVRDHTRVRGWLSRVGIAGTLIVAVGILGRATSSLFTNRPPVDFLSMTEVALSRSAPQVVGPDPTEASSFLLAQLGRAVPIPVVRDATLDGVGVIVLHGDVRIPALYYHDPTHSGRIRVAVFTYEQIDKLEETTALPAGLLSRLEEEETVYVADANKRAAATWRHRANVFVASGSDESIQSLADRLSFSADDAG
jgi:hypothetical protein